LEEERLKGKVHFLKAKLLIKVSSTVMGGNSQKSSYDLLTIILTIQQGTLAEEEGSVPVTSLY
jgi:hypothetical protein